MKKNIKIICMLLIACLMLTSCSSISTGSSKTEKLIMYLVGEEPADYSMVIDKLNEMLKEDLNAELEVRFMSWADASQKYSLLLSAGEEFDLIYATSSLKYSDYALKGGFLDITDMIKENCPKHYKAISENGILQKAKVNERVYMVPRNYLDVNPQGYVIRGDLREKYNLPEIETVDDFLDYLSAVKSGETIMPFYASSSEPFHRRGTSATYKTLGDNTYLGYDLMNLDSDEVFSTIDMDGDYQYFKKMREGYLKGYWPKDVLMNTSPSKEAFISGTSAATMSNLKNFGDIYQKIMNNHPDWKPEWYQVNKGVPLVQGDVSGVAVSKTSKKPELALKFVELLNTDKEYNMLTTYGIEGKHYVVQENGYAFPDGVTAENTGFLPDNAGNWGWRNQEYFMYSATTWPGIYEMENKLRETLIPDRYAGFVFNTDSVKTELAKVQGVIDTYTRSLEWGVVDPETVYKKYISELKKAGIKKIQAEAKKQLEEFLDN